MDDARLAESAVSIVINLYTGILQGIPNLLDILMESKESSYYHDVLSRDIEFTKNAVTIAADDISARALEIKLQEKGIPFDKMPSSLLGDQIKANGRHIFLARALDYERIVEAVQEVKTDLSPKNHDVELDLEDEKELERGDPDASVGNEVCEEGVPDAEEEELEDELESEEPAPDKRKKEKRKPDALAHRPTESTRYPEPHVDSSEREEYREWEAERIREQESNRQRDDDLKRSQEQKAQYEQYRRDTQERERVQEQKRTEASHWESDKKTVQETSGEAERTYRAERSDSEAANRDKSLNLSTGQFEQGKSTKELREEESWIAQGGAQESSKMQQQTERRNGYSSSYEGRRQEQSGSHTGHGTHSYGTDGGNVSREPYQPERSALAGGNKNVNAHFGGHYESGIGNDKAKASEITVLGNGYDADRTSYTQTNESHRTGASFAGNTGSRQAEFIMRQQKEKEQASNPPYTGSRAILGAERVHFLFDHKTGMTSNTSNITQGTIRVQCVDINTLYGNESHGKEQTSQSQKRQPFLPAGHSYDIGEQTRNFKRFDKTEEILKGRRFYQTRDLLSPGNFRNVASGSHRLVSQSVVGRDTDSGRITNEIMDYVSPAARLIKGKFLNSGAIEIARTTHCDMDILTAAFAAKNKMTLNDARSELRILRKLDASLLRNGKEGLNLVNDGAVMKKIAEAYQLQGQPASFIGMLRGFDNDNFAAFVADLNVSSELRDSLLKTPLKDLDILRIDALINKHGGNQQDKKLLQMMRAGKIMEHYPGAGSFSSLFRRYFTKMMKELGRSSDAGRALGTMINGSRNVYHAYRSGIRLLYTVLRKFKVVDTNSIAAQMIANPGKVLGRMALSKTKSGIGKGITRLGIQNTRSVAKTKRIANHASSALKFLKDPTAPLRNLLARNVLVKKTGVLISRLSSKIAVIVAKAGAILGWIAVIIIVIIILIEIFATMPGSGPTDDLGTVNYMYIQDTEIMQEIITELTAKNEAFISDINNAANHRGSYGTTTGLTADEKVGFYESGAYNIVFRDAYGNELEPSHVDLNNTKTILAMATRFIPYPFQKPSENASDEEKKAYEDIKQHFKDYSYFLWASTHQISIEEYHPGNSDGIKGALDNSGLSTTLDKGTCDQNGQTIWLKGDFAPDIVMEQYCETCSTSPATGLGAYYDDLCTHGKDGNEHGGWRKTGNKRTGVNCKAAAKGKEHHDNCDHSEDEDYCYVCSADYYKTNCSHWEYEWIYECGGHMGSVVYVTIGELSRMPGFPAATDVDYEAIGNYDTGGTISGSDVTDPEPETAAQ